MTGNGGHAAAYDLAFGGNGLDDRLFPPIAQEAEATGIPLHDPARFLFLTSVGRLLQAVAGEAPGRSGEALEQHGRLLFHAFHFWREGKRVREAGEERLRALVDGATSPGAGDLDPGTLGGAGFVRLPRNLFWASPAPGLQPEAADGFFWTFCPESDGGATLHLLLVLGVRPDRPGFSVVPAAGEAVDVARSARRPVRSGGTDFATTLPGGELGRLHSIETTAELLKLAALCLLNG
jgi:hypothetical protein